MKIKVKTKTGNEFDIECTKDEYENMLDVGYEATYQSFKAKCDTIAQGEIAQVVYEDGVVENIENH